MTTQDPEQTDATVITAAPILPPAKRKHTGLKIAGGIVGAVLAAGYVVLRAGVGSTETDTETPSRAPDQDSGSSTTCRDGWSSPSTGQGTCSWHGGTL
ncbi:hypothetical protein [Streptomyces sp. NBC_01190]|uniref:hypothetical protein n=1 Tax=Streptomyces sp. NBC_01190 TaxID=2903767 RepID=UPI00386B7679|nr:hypothetical protein OG519_34075 [Streptomyces sp. NBC_01190]